MISRTTGRTLLLAATLAWPAGLVAQRPPGDLEPEHKTRFLAVGNLARFESTNTASAGALFQVTFKESRIERMPAGNQVERSPRWYFHVLGTAGVARTGGDNELALFGQLGVVRRNDSPTFTAVGLSAQAVTIGADAIGPVARVEIMDNIGVQAGMLFFNGGEGGEGLFLSVDYMRDILSDLGLD